MLIRLSVREFRPKRSLFNRKPAGWYLGVTGQDVVLPSRKMEELLQKGTMLLHIEDAAWKDLVAKQRGKRTEQEKRIAALKARQEAEARKKERLAQEIKERDARVAALKRRIEQEKKPR